MPNETEAKEMIVVRHHGEKADPADKAANGRMAEKMDMMRCSGREVSPLLTRP